MSKEKQIEEMAEVMGHSCEKECRRNKYGEFDCEYCEAELLYNAGYRKIPDNIGDFSDGYHTFNELYHHRAALFSVICNTFPEKAWKSKLHDTGDMYEGMFIVGIETKQGQATYHYDIEPYWDMFKVKELEKAPKWDGHSPSDAIERIGSLSCEGYRKQSEGEWEWFEVWSPSTPEHPGKCNDCGWECSRCKVALRDMVGGYWYDASTMPELPFCPNCGAKMKEV